jgi:hypothetical protein
LTILVSILQQLSLHFRLMICTLVNTAWADAARMSVNDVCRAPGTQLWDNSLQPWLDKCSGSSYLTRLILSNTSGAPTNLRSHLESVSEEGKSEQQGKDTAPINIRFLPQQLVKLDVQGCSFETHHMVTAAGITLACPLASLTGLTHLSVADCRLSAASVNGLAQLTMLRELGVFAVNPASYEALCRLADVLPTLQQLTHLKLHGDVGSALYSRYRRHCGDYTWWQPGSDRTAAAAAGAINFRRRLHRTPAAAVGAINLQLPSSDVLSPGEHQRPVEVCKLHGDVHILQGLCHLSQLQH